MSSEFSLDDVKKIPKMLKWYFEEVSLQPAISNCNFLKNGDGLALSIPSDLRKQILGNGTLRDHLISIKQHNDGKGYVLTSDNDIFLITHLTKTGGKK